MRPTAIRRARIRRAWCGPFEAAPGTARRPISQPRRGGAVDSRFRPTGLAFVVPEAESTRVLNDGGPQWRAMRWTHKGSIGGHLWFS